MSLTPEQISAMREGGKILASIHKAVGEAAKPGVSTQELEDLVRELMDKNGVQPSFLGYQGYPAALCASVNNEVVHCIPSEDKILKEGDLLSVDLGVYHKGVHTDAARTHAIGTVSDEAQELLNTTREALNNAIKQVKPGNKVGDLGAAVEEVVNPHGFGIVKKLVGHGVGPELHMDPQIPNFGKKHTGPTLKENTAIAIEPMINAGDGDVTFDDWRVTTTDGSLSAHFEDTILITADGPEILTR